MRALLRGERSVAPITMAALVGLFAMAVTVLILAAGYRNQFVHLKHVIYTRCQQRDTYDRAAQHARGAQRDWFEAQIAEERGNKFIDSRLRQERIAAAQRAISGLNGALRVGAPSGCAVYK